MVSRFLKIYPPLISECRGGRWPPLFGWSRGGRLKFATPKLGVDTPPPTVDGEEIRGLGCSARQKNINLASKYNTFTGKTGDTSIDAICVSFTSIKTIVCRSAAGETQIVHP